MILLEFLNMNPQAMGRILEGPEISTIHGNKRGNMKGLGDCIGSTRALLAHGELAHPVEMALTPGRIVNFGKDIHQFICLVIEIKKRNWIETIPQIS
jgi:hypothetical protein